MPSLELNGIEVPEDCPFCQTKYVHPMKPFHQFYACRPCAYEIEVCDDLGCLGVTFKELFISIYGEKTRISTSDQDHETKFLYEFEGSKLEHDMMKMLEKLSLL